MMAAHLFNENGQMQEVDIPDIFDVLEGGEDESAVKFLLGFNGEDALIGEQVQFFSKFQVSRPRGRVLDRVKVLKGV